jgi:hypothetical protein
MKSQLRLRLVLPLLAVALAGLGVSKFALSGGEEIEQLPKIDRTAQTGAGAETGAAAADPAATDPSRTQGAEDALAAALAKHAVVVVVYYAPDGAVDSLAVSEARAGAKAAKVGFLAVNVYDEQTAQLVAGADAARDTPAVLVVRRDSGVVTRIAGFADRQTVAQAAVNAKTA